jgi:hypothetical protein
LRARAYLDCCSDNEGNEVSSGTESTLVSGTSGSERGGKEKCSSACPVLELISAPAELEPTLNDCKDPETLSTPSAVARPFCDDGI